MTKARIRTDLLGTPKKIRTKPRFAIVKVVNPKAKKPLPRECNPGGVAKAETSRRTHQTNVMAVKTSVR